MEIIIHGHLDTLYAIQKSNGGDRHKPLVSIAKKPLHCAPPRLQRIMFDLMSYRPVIVYKKGSELFIADTLSRDCHLRETQSSSVERIEIHICVPMTPVKIEELKTATVEDREMSQLKSQILEGWPSTIEMVPESLKKYWTFRDEFAVYEDIIFRGDRVVIPSKLKDATLKEIHRGHLGIQRSLSRARENVYWHKMNDDVIQHVQNCRACQYHQKDKPEEPVLTHKIPERPWQIVGADIYQLERVNYLVIADSYSGFFDFSVLASITSFSVIQCLKKWFAAHGVPETLRCDEGTQLVSREMRKFAEEWNFSVETSSPYHKRSNGLAERYVQEAKLLLMKCAADKSDMYLALLNQRNTPNGNLGSPVQRLMGRRTRGTLLTSERLLKPQLIQNVSHKLQEKRSKYKEHHDRGTKLQQPLSVGQKVLLRLKQRNWKPAVVVSPGPTSRSYMVKTPEGRVLRRNSWFLRALPGQDANQSTSTQTTTSVAQTDAKDLPCVRSELPSSADQPTPIVLSPGAETEACVTTRSGRIVRKPERYGH